MTVRTILFCLLCCMRTFASADLSAAEQAFHKGDHAAVLELAKQGNPLAQWYLGVTYGSDTPDHAPDYQEAKKWYAAALNGFLPLAKQGNPIAQFLLGVMYADGQLFGIAPDYQEAVKWYRLAADQGYHDAQDNLAYMYVQGHGVPQDSTEAVKLFGLAGYVTDAESYVGYIFETGGGLVPINFQEAIKVYRMGADQGHSEAELHLGHMYYEAEGIPQDDKEAYKWFRLAADQGDRRAQGFLGVMYELGQGVPQDYVQAHMWYNLAASASGEGGNAYAKNRDSLAEKMTPMQIAEAQRLARDWKPTKPPGKKRD